MFSFLLKKRFTELDIGADRRSERVGRSLPTTQKELDYCLQRIEREKISKNTEMPSSNDK